MWRPFSATVDGDSEQPSFSALVDAMSWVESHDWPTGVVRYLGVAVMRYDHGNVEVAQGDVVPQPARRPMFIVSTGGKTQDQMKADARLALHRFQQCKPDSP